MLVYIFGPKLAKEVTRVNLICTLYHVMYTTLTVHTYRKMRSILASAIYVMQISFMPPRNQYSVLYTHTHTQKSILLYWRIYVHAMLYCFKGGSLQGNTWLPFFSSFFFPFFPHTFMLWSWFIFQNIANTICFLVVCFICHTCFLLMNCKLCTSFDYSDSHTGNITPAKAVDGWYLPCLLSTIDYTIKESFNYVGFYRLNTYVQKSCICTMFF